MPSSRNIPVRAVLVAALTCIGAGAGAAPERVVSVNLCTDQLAMRLAGEGQLLSVSHLSRDPLMSPMTEAARAFPVNHGRAEEVFLLRPDLVLAEPYAARAGVDALRGLGIAVEMFEPVSTLDEIPERLAQMGRALGREEAAEAEIAAFNTRRAALAAPEGPRPTAALFYANGYTLGRGTLAGQLLEEAGFDNLADRLGMTHGGQMPLESLVLGQPDVVIVAGRYPGASRSEALLDHPVLTDLRARAARMTTGPEWVCGTPAALDALEALVALRKSLG